MEEGIGKRQAEHGLFSHQYIEIVEFHSGTIRQSIERRKPRGFAGRGGRTDSDFTVIGILVPDEKGFGTEFQRMDSQKSIGSPSGEAASLQRAKGFLRTVSDAGVAGVFFCKKLIIIVIHGISPYRDCTIFNEKIKFYRISRNYLIS